MVECSGVERGKVSEPARHMCLLFGSGFPVILGEMAILALEVAGYLRIVLVVLAIPRVLLVDWRNWWQLSGGCKPPVR